MADEAFAGPEDGPATPLKARHMVAAARGFAISARAKFNVRLEVGGKRADGFHAVRSFIADLAVCDELEFSPAGAFAVDCDDPTIARESNLAYKAALALSIDLPPVRVLVNKRVPLRAGLGGGSADAAATLRGIARAMSEAGNPIDEALLVEAAAKTGSDVAACLVAGLKIVEGKGDLVRRLPFAAPSWGVLLLKPSIGVDTSAAYRILDEARDETGDRFAGEDAVLRLADAIEARDFVAACALAHNDFQNAIEAAFAPIADARARLRAAGAPATVLCGSGACVAGLFATIDAARIASSRIALADDEWSCATGFAP